MKLKRNMGETYAEFELRFSTAPSLEKKKSYFWSPLMAQFLSKKVLMTFERIELSTRFFLREIQEAQFIRGFKIKREATIVRLPVLGLTMVWNKQE